MKAGRLLAQAQAPWAEALAGSDSVVHLGGASATVKALLTHGRTQWQSHRAHRLPALMGIGDMDMLSLLLTAIVDQHRVLLCAGDTVPTALCDAHISAKTAENATASLQDITPQSTMGTEWPDGFAVLSSGTLGAPKVIWHRHHDLLATSAMVLRRLQISADDRVLITVPLHHMYGLGAALVPALLAGAQIHLLPKANLLGFNDALRAFDPTLVYSTPHLLRALLQRKSESLKNCRGLVLAGDGTAPLLHAQAQRVFNQVFDLYGTSELGVVAISEPNLPQALHPLEGVRVFPAERSAAQSNLIVVHPHAATHIAHDGKLFAVPSEWDTRDIATFTGNAVFSVQGRADLSLNRAGKLLVLAELERIIMGWPGVELAVAIVLEDDTAAGKAIAMVIKPSTATLTIDALKQLAAETLPVFARPDRYTLVPDLPCLGSGKPDRNAIIKDHCHG
jgi:acyl-coenzyme A synthetase/AMP-(fatty) acid ligase